MKISKHIIAAIFLFACISSSAQAPELLRAEGEIPKEFISSSTTKYQKEVETLKGKKIKKKEKKDQSQFLLESSFVIDNILQSGIVLFNDPATVYVNKVLNNLPIEDSGLKKKNPRAYVLNSSAVNAFATHQGIIFVTLGLLANLENEAQLAFILSHELVHVKHQHSLNKFLHSKDIDRNKNRRASNVDKIGFDRSLFKHSMYSRQLEEEADEKGLEIFLKSNYDPKAIIHTFTVLHYSYLPFEDFPFEKTFFEDDHYVFPVNLWLEKLNGISPMEDDKTVEERSSHPNSAKRMKNLESKITTVEKADKKVFILPEDEFRSIQSRARYQIPFLNLYAENFPEAIYTSYLMLKEYPNDTELKKVIGKSLYMEAKYKNYAKKEGRNRNKQLVKIAEKTEGEVQQLYNLLSVMDHAELTVLATKYNWDLYKKNKEDEELSLMMKDMFIEFAGNFDGLHDFSSDPKPATVDSLAVESEQEEKQEESLSKYEKIKNTAVEAEYWKYAYIDELKSEDFKTHFETGMADLKKIKERNEYYENQGWKEYAKQRKKEEKKGKKLGIRKVVVVNPFYLSLDERKDGSIQYIRSEEKQEEFRNAIDDLAKKSKLDATVLDVSDLSTGDTDKFNDIAEVNQYLSQQMDHYDLSLTPGYNQNKINAIAEKYGTEYFLWTGVISLKEKNGGAWAMVGVSVIMPYLLPFTIANAVTPKYDMLYYAILYDVKTGRRSIIKMDYFDKRDSKTILNAHIYDVFHQISSRAK